MLYEVITAVLLRVVGELRDDELLQLLVVAEDRAQRLPLALERFSLVVQLHAVELGELAEAQVDDVFGRITSYNVCYTKLLRKNFLPLIMFRKKSS